MFAGLSAEQKREIELAGSRRIVRRERFFFREGEQPIGLHVLLSGRLKSSRFLSGEHGEHEIVMHFVNPGEVFGEIPVFLGCPYPASARAVEECEVFTLPLQALERLVTRQPEVALRIFRGMARKLSNLLDRIEAHKGLRAEERIARYLVSRCGPLALRKGVVFTLPVTKKEWAGELGLQPESLSRSLARLSEGGIIRVQGRNIHVAQPVRLAELAGATRAH